MKPNIGIYAPGWVIGKYNTDQRITKSFGRLNEFADVETTFVASSKYTLSFNADKLIRFSRLPFPSVLQHGLNTNRKHIDLVYQYGESVVTPSFFKATGKLPVFVTTGFMTDNYITKEFGKLTDRQAEADKLAHRLEKASVIHFHTEGGRQRFLHYRPELKEKAVAIPFFLPGLEMPQHLSFQKEKIKILFVGYDGKRKGLFELITALDMLGRDYLNNNNVSVTIVSKDKPAPTTGFDLEWHPKLSNKEILELMRSSSIFVLVPKLESYGLVLIEAMISGCAVITDNDDTRKEILEENGVFLSEGSPKKIAASLQLLIEDAAYRKKISENAFARASSRFMPEVVAAQYLHSFKSII